MSEAPTVDTSSPEFQAAVRAMAAELLAPMREEITTLREAVATKPQPESAAPAADMGGVAEVLAMAIANLSDQGTGRKRVAPEVLKERHQAREQMVALLEDFRRRGITCVYTLRNKVYLGEQIVDPVWIDRDKKQQATAVEYALIPNEGMVPLNEPAKDVYNLFIKSIGSIHKPVVEAKMAVTPGGLVVHKGRERLANPIDPSKPRDPGAHLRAADDVKIVGRGGPAEYREVPILGTIAKPALQSV